MQDILLLRRLKKVLHEISCYKVGNSILCTE